MEKIKNMTRKKLRAFLMCAPTVLASVVQKVERAAAIVLITLISLSLVVIATVLTIDHLNQGHQVITVKSSASAGEVMGVQLHSGLFSRSLVETTTGFYALVDGASLRKGEAVVIEELEHGARQLCDSARRCIRLMRPNF